MSVTAAAINRWRRSLENPGFLGKIRSALSFGDQSGARLHGFIVPSRDLNRGIVELPKAGGKATADSSTLPSPVIASTNVVASGDDALVAERVGRRRRLRGRRSDDNR
jgi:hypothetical protein